jgi:ATP-dependent DNA helicase RecG
MLAVPDADRLAETLVALANADGGTVLVGLAPDGTITEGLLPEEIESCLRLALSRCQPPVRTEWEHADVEQGTLAAIRVPRSTELHSLDDGRVLIRSGAENSPLGGEAIRQLAATKSTGDFEVESVPGAIMDSLDDEVIAEYVVKTEERRLRALDQTIPELLRAIGALDGRGQPTVLGLLLFGREPQDYLTQSDPERTGFCPILGH